MQKAKRIKMTNDEYKLIQRDLSVLLDDEHRKRFRGLSKDWKNYKDAVLKCKSVLSNYKPFGDCGTK